MRRLPRRLAGLTASVMLGATLIHMPSASAAPIIRNPGEPFYEVELSTGGQGHVWTGTQSISFTNLEPAPLSTLYLRVWSNGVVGCGGSQDSITVSAMQGGSFTEALDCTELEVALPSPLAQGERTTISFDLRIEVPERNDRFGYHNGLALVGTAIPTLEVHDDDGWHPDPFIDLGESFYSIAGRYRVTLETPVALDTPTTGIAVSRATPSPGRISTTYVARDVRDFAWAAGHLKRLVGHSRDVRVAVSYQPSVISHERAARALHYAERSMHTFSRSFGRFPYPEMDVVLAGFATFGGMEYPTIIFSNPDRATVSHEMAHQWWYGIVGDDEFAEPWLDESFATWSEGLPFWGPWVGCGPYLFARDDERISNDMTYWATHPNLYGTVYGGGACMLAELASQFGIKRFTAILRRYADHHWLGVARTAEFQTAIEKAAATHMPGRNMARFWERWRVG
ncbi:MAG TPA: M1 family metallopeptidase [Actinomycetota bacterium]